MTLRSYAEIVRLHLKPTLGKLSAAKLTPQDIDRLLVRKLDDGHSPQRIQYIRAVLRMAFNQAMKWGHLGRNVVQLSVSPKVHPPAVRPKSPAEALSLLAAVKGDRLEALYTLVATTGLRQGEALAQRWKDLDLQHGTLTAAGTLQKIDGAYQRREHAKTKHSRRVLCLPPPN
jgi:integrase